MKLRQLPTDFKVEEIGEFKFSKDADKYKLYLLEKIGVESFYLLKYLSKKNSIPFSAFGIAGLKDKHALTRQYLTIPSNYGIGTLSEENFKLTFMGYVGKSIRSGDLTGNRFDIVVRDLRKGELDGVYRKAETLSSIGVPNYFDSQRFGSVIKGEFIAKAVLNKDYERAVKLFLTGYTKSESRRVKDEKRMILKSWGDLSGLNVRNKTFAAVIGEYLKTKNWLNAYKKIPSTLREIFVSAYQSYFWNECVKEVLRRAVNPRNLYPIKYNAGSLLFYKKLSSSDVERIPVAFKTVSDRMTLDGFEGEVIHQMLSHEGLCLSDFEIKKATGNFFKTHERCVVVAPTDFSISPPDVDELNDRGKNNRFKVTVSFTLPKGSYATVVTKRLFNK